jgi:hypothetical protein
VESETLDHLLVQCVYSRETWFKVLWCCGWQQLTPTRTYQVVSWWLYSKKWVSKHRWQAFDTLVLLVTRCIWLQRNDWFKGAIVCSQQPARLVQGIWEVAELWSRARLVALSHLVSI